MAKKRLPKTLAQAMSMPVREALEMFDGWSDGDGNSYEKQVCLHCGGVGTGLGINHTDDCLVPLAIEAAAAERASRGRR